ncbi:hypothetical protein FGIG_07878 [Fasciola gigantica]|uniref:Uncharacterized protein n=1 Tax=Fasciola gigantica TaxID=46835 RepID=A0A504YSF2_FASGI|nr:hypothetical protein FGIG_07878 [Fasciola gigantica]
MEIEREREQVREANEVRKSMLDASADHDETEAVQKNDQLECTRTPDRIIRRPNIEVKELTLGSRDRMSMVMEEDEDSFDLNNNTSAEEFDAILIRNSVVTEDGSMDICPMGLVAEDLFNDRRRSVTPNNLVFFPAAAGVPDVDEVSGGGVADEVENHKSMGERWGETNYATVLRQSVPMPPQKPQYEDSFDKVISIRTAPEGSSSPSEATVNCMFLVFNRLILQVKHLYSVFFGEIASCSLLKSILSNWMSLC